MRKKIERFIDIPLIFIFRFSFHFWEWHSSRYSIKPIKAYNGSFVNDIDVFGMRGGEWANRGCVTICWFWCFFFYFSIKKEKEPKLLYLFLWEHKNEWWWVRWWRWWWIWNHGNKREKRCAESVGRMGACSEISNPSHRRETSNNRNKTWLDFFNWCVDGKGKGVVLYIGSMPRKRNNEQQKSTLCAFFATFFPVAVTAVFSFEF